MPPELPTNNISQQQKQQRQQQQTTTKTMAGKSTEEETTVVNQNISKCINSDILLLQSLGWDAFVKEKRGSGDMGDLNFNHPALNLLKKLKQDGTPVTLAGSQWSQERIQLAISRGPHKSARDHEAFVKSEFKDMIDQRQWVVLPYEIIKHLPELRVSPMGVVPQKDRRPRIIVDYSFYDVNEQTVQTSAPIEAMQFGHALPRIIQNIVNADPIHGPVWLSKVDLTDGFYRIEVTPKDVPKLGVVIPPIVPDQPLIAFPLTLPMGWKNSPPYFCAVTETITDLTNSKLLRHERMPPHRLDHLANTKKPIADSSTLQSQSTQQPQSTKQSPSNLCQPGCNVTEKDIAQVHNSRTKTQPLATWEIYMDDFVGMAQGPIPRRERIQRTLFHTIDEVLRPIDELDFPLRKEPISLSKLEKGDANWSTNLKVLGWELDTVAGTLTLPPNRRQRLFEILYDEIPENQRRISVNKWHRLLGELRSMSIAIPGSRGIFSHLQATLKAQHLGRIHISLHVRAAIQDFRWMAQSLQDRPTRMHELVAQQPRLMGITDASGLGMGGIVFPTTATQAPLLWQIRLPKIITQQLVSSDNPKGRITNSDLELAAIILQHDVYAQNFNVTEITVHTNSDNTAAISWQDHGSTSTDATPAYLLRMQAIHQRFHRYIPLVSYIPGPPAILENLPTDIQDAFLSDLHAAETATRSGVVPSRAAAARTHWNNWLRFCTTLRMDPFLQMISDPVCILQVYAQRYRTGSIAPSRRTVRSRTVEDSLRAIGQTFASVGANDPRLNHFGTIDFRLQRQLRYYTRQDPPPDRVKPIPPLILRHVLGLAHAGTDIALCAIADMIAIAFFFLLRPGEYTGTPSDTTPFTVNDVQLYIGQQRFSAIDIPLLDLGRVTFATLTFTTQKNGVRGEVIGLGRSGEPLLCPVLALSRRIRHLRSHPGQLHSPLASYFPTPHTTLRLIKPADITYSLRASTLLIGPTVGFLPADISARSLRASGAMALLCAHVDTDSIRLIGRWRSDVMLRYLHVQAEPFMRNFARRMVQHGDFTLLPNQDVPT